MNLTVQSYVCGSKCKFWIFFFSFREAGTRLGPSQRVGLGEVSFCIFLIPGLFSFKVKLLGS